MNGYFPYYQTITNLYDNLRNSIVNNCYFGPWKICDPNGAECRDTVSAVPGEIYY